MFTQLTFSKRTVSFALALLLSLASGMLMAGCPPKPTPPPPDDEIPPVVIPSLAPGVLIVVEEIAIPEDLRPEVVFTIQDDKGNLVNASELSDARWIIGYLEDPAPGSTARFISYTTRVETASSGDTAVQADYDPARLNGISDNGDGTYTYKFATALPEDYNPDATHQLAGQFRRTFVVDGKSYIYNLIEPFVPSGGEVKQAAMREIVVSESCNDCHTRLSVHGDIRREIQLCIMCHSNISSDAQSGNSIEFAEMIHKIHRGADLPSVLAGDPYQIIGFGNSVHDYSTVHFPQDIRNCTVCHDGGAQSDFHLTKPTLEGCASCHDRTWFGDKDATPEGWTWHVGGAHADNQLCALCHTPTAPGTSPILEAHIIPTKSDAAPGLVLDVLDVQVAAPLEEGANGRLIVTFSAEDKTGPITDLSALSSMAILVGWPAPEYQANRREAVVGGGGPAGTLVNNGNGTYAYTFASAAIPTSSGETFAVGLEARRNFTFRGETYTQGIEGNSLTYFTTDGSEPVMRREIIAQEKCNTCHDEIRFHGAQRVGVDLCVICHNTNATDIARRPADELPPVTVNFKDMIHKIHQGEDLEAPYTVYGFGGVAHDFTHVRFPGLQQQCNICHIDGTEQLPLPDVALSTWVRDGQGETVADMLPETASCTSCHDSITSVFHAQLQSDLLARAESCSVCHGADASFAVSVMHALNP